MCLSKGNKTGRIRTSSILVLLSLYILPLSAGTPAVKLDYSVCGVIRHDRSSYTQGLFIYGGFMYESAGQYGESSFRKTDFSGRVLESKGFDGRYFLEGSCEAGGYAYVLTWRENTCFVIDMSDMTQVAAFSYEGEGWGLAYDGTSLVMSDGSSRLRFIDPQTFSEIRSVEVTMNGRPLPLVNELEFAKGLVWANIYLTDMIVAIDPETGAVKYFLDMGNLYPKSERPYGSDVLNGIAYDAEMNEFFVTGKKWDRMFRIKIEEK